VLFIPPRFSPLSSSAPGAVGEGREVRSPEWKGCARIDGWQAAWAVLEVDQNPSLEDSSLLARHLCRFTLHPVEALAYLERPRLRDGRAS